MSLHSASLRLNPFDRAPGDRGGIPILPGRLPGVGHLIQVRMALPDLLAHAKLTVGPLFFLDMPSPMGRALDLVPLHGDYTALLRSSSLSNSIVRDNAQALFGESMIVQDGDEHHRQRLPWSAPFTPRGLAGGEVGGLVAEIVARHIEAWVRIGRVRVLDVTQHLTLELIFRLLGSPSGDLAEWRAQYRRLLLVVARLPVEFPGSPASRGERARTWIDARIDELLARRLCGGADGSFLASLAAASALGSRSMRDDHLRDNLKLLFLAGHETTATAMSWLLVELGRSAELFRRLQAEAEHVGGLPSSPEDTRRFPFATSLVREVVRLYPPVPLITRVVREDLEILGHTLARGTRVTVPLVEAGRDPSRYPAPLRFDPDRWRGRNVTPASSETLAFGAGPHFCLGYHLAILQLVTFAVAVALTCKARGKRPTHPSRRPRSVWFPVAAPIGASIRFD
ncbi:MAG: cytochrome P450 [Myxococcales bacterium]|nr:cytochrome P450 [Myxococcales bacterium]